MRGRAVQTPFVEDLTPGAGLYATSTAYHGCWKYAWNDQEARMWRRKMFPQVDEDSWIGWQRQDYQSRGKNMLC